MLYNRLNVKKTFPKICYNHWWFITILSQLYRWNIYLTWNVSFTNYIWNNVYPKKINIHIIISVPLLKLRYILWEGNKSQHTMLDNTYNRNISIHNYYKEILLKFMSVLWILIIRSLTLVYLKVISNIKC